MATNQSASTVGTRALELEHWAMETRPDLMDHIFFHILWEVGFVCVTSMGWKWHQYMHQGWKANWQHLWWIEKCFWEIQGPAIHVDIKTMLIKCNPSWDKKTISNCGSGIFQQTNLLLQHCKKKKGSRMVFYKVKHKGKLLELTVHSFSKLQSS